MKYYVFEPQKKKSEKKKAWNSGIWTHVPSKTSAVLYRLSYLANWRLFDVLWVRKVPVDEAQMNKKYTKYCVYEM